MSVIYGSPYVGGSNGSSILGTYLSVYIPSWVVTINLSKSGKSYKPIYTESGRVVYNLDETGDYILQGSGSSISKSLTLTIDKMYHGYYTTLFDLNNTSFSTIKQIGVSGLAQQTWSINERKNVTISGREYEIAIMDFDTYDVVNEASYGRQKNSITFGLVNLFETSYSAKGSGGGYNAGGWRLSGLKTACNSLHNLSKISQDLYDSITLCNLPYVGTYLYPSTISFDTDSYFFVPSLCEFYGNVTGTGVPAAEGRRFEYYQTESNYNKRNVSGQDYQPYWTRTIYTTNYTNYFYISHNGTRYSYYKQDAEYGCWISFCFCI